jgi:hypothetical protein
METGMEEGRVACELGAERTVSPPSVRVKDMEYNAGWYRAMSALVRWDRAFFVPFSMLPEV